MAQPVSYQVRSRAWTMRSCDSASIVALPGSKEQVYFDRIMDKNWQYMLDTREGTKKRHGELWGRVDQPDLAHGVWLPMNQGFFAVQAARTARRNAKALEYLLTYRGRYLFGAFDIPNWTASALAIYAVPDCKWSGPPVTTFAAMKAACRPAHRPAGERTPAATSSW